MSAIENILGMLPDRVGTGKNIHIYTPAHIAKEMVEALPPEVFNGKTTFFDPCCKSGIFLYEVYKKLMEAPELVELYPTKSERTKHIVNNQLFGIAPDNMCQLMSTRAVYGYIPENSHIISFGDNYIHVMQKTDKSFLYNTLKEKFGTMKFDVVIGNPPYNRGMDLDFVDLGYKLSNKYTCMITPAKWQTAEADQKIASNISYGEFRKLYVPKMKWVKYWAQTPEVFNIAMTEGISAYLIDKNNVYDKCMVENICSIQPYFSGIAERDIRNAVSLVNVGNEIFEYVKTQKDYYPFKFPFCGLGDYYVYLTNMTNTGGGGSVAGLFSSAGSCMGLSVCRIYHKNNVGMANGKCIFISNSKEECENFISFINTRLVRFLVVITARQTGVLCDYGFRFVPAPPSGKFDHIYTDEEMYEAFNLPQKYIDVIEAVIKERK